MAAARLQLVKNKYSPLFSIGALGPEVDILVPAQSAQRDDSHKPSSSLPLLSAMHAATFPAGERHYSLVKRQCAILLRECRRGVVIPLLSVTHGQCDARPTVTYPAYAGTKFILLGDSVNNFHILIT